MEKYTTADAKEEDTRFSTMLMRTICFSHLPDLAFLIPALLTIPHTIV